MRIPIYLVVKEAGLFNQDNLRQVVILDVKLTRASAEKVKSKFSGAAIYKMMATKDLPDFENSAKT